MALDLPIILGNWKMNGLAADALPLADGLARRLREAGGSGTLGIFPPATVLRAVAECCAGSGVMIGGQDCHAEAKGAFTGSIAAEMLADAGAGMVLVGHSERRHGLGESDAVVRAKAGAAARAGLTAVLCIGETEAEWQDGRTRAVVEEQLEGSLPPGTDADAVLVAYEPVWAIGTGRTASADDIAGTHAVIRAKLSTLVEGGQRIPILYGGSVKPDNAAAILAITDVDGVLVGGASLDGDAFWSMFAGGGAP